MKKDLSINRRKNLADEVIRKLEELIITGELLPGERLPPLKDMAEYFNVGISSVREGVSALTGAGLLESCAGKGTYVSINYSPTIDAWLGIPSDEKRLIDINEARIILETQINILAAKRIDNEYIEKLHKILDEMKLCLNDLKKYIELDFVFHLLVAKSTHNKVLAQMYKAVQAALKYAIVTNVKISYKNWGNTMKPSFESHAKLLKAISNHDVDLAKEVTREYLDRALSFYKENPYLESDIKDNYNKDNWI